MNRTKSLIKNTFIISLGTFFPQITSIITLPILTSKLTTSEYGYFDLIATLISLLIPAITLQIQAAGFRFLISCKNNKNKSTEYITNIFFVLGISIFISIFLLFFIFRKLNYITIIIIILYFIFDVLNNAINQIIRGFSKNMTYSIGSILQSIMKTIMICILLLPMNLKLEGAVLAMFSGVLVSFLFESYSIRVWRYLDLKKISKNTIKELLSYSWPMVPNTLSGWVLRASDRLIITWALGIKQNAIYAVANKIPTLLNSMNSTFTIAWQENASLSSNDKDVDDYYSKTFDGFTKFIGGGTAILIASSPVLFKILIRGNYQAAYNQMSILYIGIFYSCISSYLGGIYIANKKTKNVGITTIFAAIVNLIIDFLLVKNIGITAGSLSTLISYTILVYYRMFDLKKIQNLKYNYKNLLIINGLLIVMAILSYLNHIYINIINFIIGFVGAIFLNHEIIISFYSLLKKKLKKTV